MRGAWACGLLVVLLAGCVDAPPAPPEGAAATTATLWLTRDGFSATAPTAAQPQRVPAGNFFRAWAVGEGLPTWRGPGPEGAYVVTNATVVVWAEAPRGSAQTGRFPSYLAYLGPAGFPMGDASLPPPGVTPPGTVQEVTFALGLPEGGLVVRAGEPLELIVTPVQTNDDEADPVVFLVGSADRPSRVELDLAPVALPPEGEPATRAESGRLVGSAYAVGAREAVTAQRYEVELPEDVARVEVAMRVTRHAGVPDVDLAVLGADGQVLARSVTPYGVEGIRLLGPNLEAARGGRVVVEVVDYGSAVVEYDVAIATAVAR